MLHIWTIHVTYLDGYISGRSRLHISTTITYLDVNISARHSARDNQLRAHDTIQLCVELSRPAIKRYMALYIFVNIGLGITVQSHYTLYGPSSLIPFNHITSIVHDVTKITAKTETEHIKEHKISQNTSKYSSHVKVPNYCPQQKILLIRGQHCLNALPSRATYGRSIAQIWGESCLVDSW